MASDPRDNQNDDFDPDIFDGEEEFLQDDFDSESFDEAEYAQGDIGDDEFADDDWQDDGDAQSGGYQEAPEKKGLSFNTIVIIGAVVVGGGVMAMTVMGKSAEQAASNQGVFQSFLNITGVMDGMLFGEKETIDAAPEQAGNQDGFLNNPNSLAEGGTPPQPVPMSPLEEEGPDLNQPLTPLPDDMYAGVPRGPEEAPATQDIAEPSPQPAMSAQDILEQAMANREKKNEPAAEKTEENKLAQAENTPAQEAPVEPVAATPAPVPAPTPTPVPTAIPAPALTPVVTTPLMSPAQEKALTDNTKAMGALSESMNKVVSRIDRMEGELANVRESQQASYQKLEATVETLKKEMKDLKDRPIPAAPAPQKKEDVAVEKKAEIRVPVQKTPEPVAKKPAPVATQATPKPKAPVQQLKAKAVASSSAPWELRAAQPGRAWISKAGAKDMQGVQIGQTVDGLGRITAITYQNGRWTVSGTGGTIHQ